MDKAISEAMTSRFRRFVFFLLLLTLAVASASVANAQTCQTSSDLDDASRAPILAAAQRYFDMLAKGDAASLRQNAVPSLASDFSGVESLVKERQPDLAGAPAPSPKFFLLQVEGAAPGRRHPAGTSVADRRPRCARRPAAPPAGRRDSPV